MRGLKIAAVAVVAQALWGMGTTPAPDKARASVAIAAAIAILLSPFVFSIVAVIIVAGAFGWWRFQHYVDDADADTGTYSIWKPLAIGCAAVFALILIGLPLLRQIVDIDILNIFDGFFRSGSLVFGGGHVVLPTLESEVVENGWVTT